MSRRHADAWLAWSGRAAAGTAAAIAALVVIYLLLESLPALRAIAPHRFFTDASWHPAGDPRTAQYNLLPMLAATLALTAGAALVAGPLGLASALFTCFYAPAPLAAGYRRLLELLAGIPSVIFGFWGLVVLAPAIARWQPPGQGLLAGALILGLMILPTIALLTDAAVRQVPRPHLEAAAALGLSRSATLRIAVYPAARGAILTAATLAVGRAIGETMAVLMVSGNVVQLPRSIAAPVRALTANIALELGYALDLHRSALFVGGLLLMLLVGALTLLASRRDGAPA